MVDCDVMIVGAGPTGMAAAIALHDSGLKVMIIDKHETGLSFSRAILVNTQTLQLLKPYGIADKIMALGRPFSSVTINGPSGVIIDGLVDIDKNADVHPTALPQLLTETCFIEGLSERGISVTRPCTLKNFQQTETFVESTLETADRTYSVRSKYLLGADGFHSVVREHLGVSYNRSATPQLMYSQDAVIDWAGRSDLTIWILESGAAIAMRIGENKVRFAATDKTTFLSLNLANKIEKTTWESEFEVYFAQADIYGDERVWIAGDAAHVHSPVGGRGMNIGVADGIAFARAIIEGDLQRYQKERHSLSRDWVRKNKLFTQIMTDKTLKGKFGRATVRLIFRMISIFSGKKAAKTVFQAIAVG